VHKLLELRIGSNMERREKQAGALKNYYEFVFGASRRNLMFRKACEEEWNVAVSHKLSEAFYITILFGLDIFGNVLFIQN
jgi:hypothetical protein